MEVEVPQLQSAKEGPQVLAVSSHRPPIRFSVRTRPFLGSAELVSMHGRCISADGFCVHHFASKASVMKPLSAQNICPSATEHAAHLHIKIHTRQTGQFASLHIGKVWHVRPASMVVASLEDNVSSCEQLCLWLGRAQQRGPEACKEGEANLCTSKEDEVFMNRLDAEVHRVNRCTSAAASSGYWHTACMRLPPDALKYKIFLSAYVYVLPRQTAAEKALEFRRTVQVLHDIPLACTSSCAGNRAKHCCAVKVLVFWGCHRACHPVVIVAAVMGSAQCSFGCAGSLLELQSGSSRRLPMAGTAAMGPS